MMLNVYTARFPIGKCSAFPLSLLFKLTKMHVFVLIRYSDIFAQVVLLSFLTVDRADPASFAPAKTVKVLVVYYLVLKNSGGYVFMQGF
jgi:hypothetical protein